jgi:hypothetical protein
MKPLFDHEKLDVYQEAIAFCGWVGEFLDTFSGKTAAKGNFRIDHEQDYEQEQEKE